MTDYRIERIVDNFIFESITKPERKRIYEEGVHTFKHMGLFDEHYNEAVNDLASKLGIKETRQEERVEG